MGVRVRVGVSVGVGECVRVDAGASVRVTLVLAPATGGVANVRVRLGLSGGGRFWCLSVAVNDGLALVCQTRRRI